MLSVCGGGSAAVIFAPEPHVERGVRRRGRPRYGDAKGFLIAGAGIGTGMASTGVPVWGSQPTFVMPSRSCPSIEAK